LQPGESVLDVGCGTGTLALTAKRRVGASGAVVGIDASPEMIERAKRKALKAGVEVQFQTALVERLPFPDASFDVVFSTLMLHHLPRPVREQCAREMRRVIKPDGRIVAVDFATPARERKGLFARLHRHGYMALRDIVGLLSEAGLRVTETGAVGVSDLQFVIACAPALGRSEDLPSLVPSTRSLDRLPLPRWIWVPLIVAVLLAHGIVIRAASSRLTLSVVAMTGVVVLFAVMHSGFVGVIHTLLRRRKV
jgi:SAM-dependent methyltransferase